MYSKEQIWNVKDLASQGTSKTEIARITGISRPTIDKFLGITDFNDPVPEPLHAREKKPSLLDPLKPVIDGYLQKDKEMGSLKQSHTARRVFDRLRTEEGYCGSYSTVASYVGPKKKELFEKKAVKKQFIPLLHHPGEGQGDFGTANYVENGVFHTGKYFCLSFPYSNAGLIQLKPGENEECLLESMRAIFEYIGGIPREIWLDNASTMIITSSLRYAENGQRKMNERFEAFSRHYQFKPVFMNPYSGNEKGNVEAKNAYLRRQLLVPVPEFTSMDDYNAELLTRSDALFDKKHYRKNVSTRELYEEDKSKFLPLPGTPFNTEAYMQSVSTDKYGFIKMDNGTRIYSTDGEHSSSRVRVKLTSREVTIMDEENNVIVVHQRLYAAHDGDKKDVLTSMNWIPYLKTISMKPRSFRNSGIYEMMPSEMKAYLDSVSNSERGKVLRVLCKITEKSGFESAVDTVTKALAMSARDPDSLEMLYNRVYSDVPQMEEIPSQDLDGIPKLARATFDPSIYDCLLKGGNKRVVKNGEN